VTACEKDQDITVRFEHHSQSSSYVMAGPDPLRVEDLTNLAVNLSSRPRSLDKLLVAFGPFVMSVRRRWRNLKQPAWVGSSTGSAG